MNGNEVSRFKGLLKVLNIVYLIGIILTGLSTLLLIGLTIFISILSESDLNKFFKADNAKVSLKIGGIDYQFTKSYIANNFDVNKDLLIGILLVTVLNTILVLLIMWFAKKLVNAFSSHQIFLKQNGTYIETIAILFLIVGHLYKLMVSMLGSYIDQSMNLSNYLIGEGIVSKVTYHLFNIDFGIILIAVTIWLIGRAFKYGAFLQDEYDATV